MPRGVVAPRRPPGRRGSDRFYLVEDDHVAAAAREPDFFELLKAAINVGSIGKGSCYDYSNTKSDFSTPGTSGNLQQARDTLTSLQILQIGANIIDQTKADNFPTRIQFSGDLTVPKNEVRGVEDLPYFYGFRNWITQYSLPTATSPGMGALLVQPELWNPHSLGSSTGVTGANTPTNFRVRVAPDPSSTLTSGTIVQLTAYYAWTEVSGTTKTTYTDVVDLSNTVAVNPSVFVSGTIPAPLQFQAGAVNSHWDFREPTLLGVSTMPSSCKMTSSPYNDVYTKTNDTGILLTGSIPFTHPESLVLTTGSTNSALQKVNINVPSGSNACCLRFYLDYQDTQLNWITYDEQIFEYQQGASSLDVHVLFNHTTYQDKVTNKNENWCGATRTDPRTSRWIAEYTEYYYLRKILDPLNNIWGSMRPDAGISLGCHLGGMEDSGISIYGSYKNYSQEDHGNQLGYPQENSVRNTYQTDDTNFLRYIRDPDGVVRRTMGAYVTDTNNGGSVPTASLPLTGLPMAVGNYSSRPTILHRPFRSVAELGYVFRDTPWGNINFSVPESGDSALLDVFCINENTDPNGMVAGKVNLNTRQAPVLQALIANALRDKDDASNPVLSGTIASDLAAQLVKRTTTIQPLLNRADLVGSWHPADTTLTTPTLAGTALKTIINPDSYYTGFSLDIGTVPSIKNDANALPISLIPRQRESVIRALADAGNTRTWNLLIDVVAQSGRFPASAASANNPLAQFMVEGETRYWLHVAIDRYTGTVLDSQLEIVK